MLKAVPTKPVETKEVPQALGFYVCLEIWITPEKIGSVYVADQTRTEDKYSRPVGRVVSLGADAYSGSSYKNGPWCAENDWVMFDRGNAIANNYFGIAYAFVPDDKIVAKISDPNQHRRINAGDKA